MMSAGIEGDGEDVATSNNLDLVDRLVREHVNHAEDASLRTQRCRTRGVINLLSNGPDANEGPAQEARHQTGLAWLEKAVFVAPWDQRSRLALSKTTT